MLIADFYKVPILIALTVVLIILALSVVISLAFPPKVKLNESSEKKDEISKL